MKSLMVIFLCFLFVQCEKNFDPISNEKPIEFSSMQKQVAASADRFGLNLFRALNNSEKDSNIFISPLSVSVALGMTLNGADNTTYEEMKSTLELEGLNQQQINETYQSLIHLLTQIDPKVIFTIANSIWYRNTYTFNQTFLDVNKKYFDAQIQGLDFIDPNSVDIINQWVNNNTNGKIKQIIDFIPDHIVMYLINAIYFKGTWKYEFDKSETLDDFFTLPNGNQVPCKLMVQGNDYMYLHTQNFQAIDLPYGDGHFSMTVFLPTTDFSVDSLISNLTEENWASWLNSFELVKGNLYLPKFELEYENNLNVILQSLGMTTAFLPFQADFSNMYSGPQNLYIDEVKHKTYVKVDEEGTEAAAVTSVSIGNTSVGGSSGFIMRVDRPFIFVIREKNSGSILFIGKIVEPVWED